MNKKPRSDFENLVAHALPRLRQWAARRLGRKVQQDLRPSDVVQETLYRAWLGSGEFKGDEAGFSAWLATIAENRVRMAARARGAKKRRIPSRLTPVGCAQPPQDGLANTLARECEERLEMAARELTREQWETFRAHVLQGVSYEEIAAQSSRTVPAVRALIHRARAKLAVELEDLRDRPRSSAAEECT